MTVQIDDVIILGRGVPEQISDGRRSVCVAGYSPTVGFVRLYPTRVDSPLKNWNIVSVDVERNPQDSRAESWKFPDSRVGWENINQHIRIVGEYPREHRLGLMDSLQCSCVGELNECRVSLGIVRPVFKRTYLSPNKMYGEAFQPLFDIIEHAGLPTKRDCYFEPRIEFLCGSGCRAKGCHDQQLLDWSCYQWMVKNPGKEQQIWDNLHISDKEWSHYLLVGNQANQRTSYMVIGVIRQRAVMVQPALIGGAF